MKLIGKKILHFKAVESTNDFAWREALHGATDGTVIMAETQTKGRGRLGRSFQTADLLKVFARRFTTGPWSADGGGMVASPSLFA